MIRHSKLQQHKVEKGLIKTPLNTIEGLTLISWAKDRLPEYLWLGLILMNYERSVALNKIIKILRTVSQEIDDLYDPKVSQILSLPFDQQEIIYKIIADNIDNKVLAPLTAIYRDNQYKKFNEYFYFKEMKVVHRINLLSDAIETFYDHQSHLATDLRFSVILLAIFRKRICFSHKVHHIIDDHIIDAIMEYPKLNHEDEKMRSYRASIRALEPIASLSPINDEFNKYFWREISLKIACKPVGIKYEVQENETYANSIVGYKKQLDYLIKMHKEELIFQQKFDVIIGATTYALRIYNEIVENKLGNSILARGAFRTVIEVYIMMKYLLKIENEHSNVWEDYKSYGMGKYKHQLLLKESDSITEVGACFNEELIRLIVNEIKYEEFLDIDTKYFDNTRVKEKFKEVNEENLYKLPYEYSTNFIHGLWGAIRESSMYVCKNASHQNHLIPDINFETNLSNIYDDFQKVMERIFSLVNEIYPFSENYLKVTNEASS